MQVLDVTGALARLAELPLEEATLVGLTEGPGRWELLALPPGQAWSPDDDPQAARAVLVLDGVATWRVEGTRQSLASGHLLLVEAGTSLAVDNDGMAPVSALIRTSVASGSKSASQ